MKRFLVFLMALVTVLSLAACHKEDTTPEQSGTDGQVTTGPAGGTQPPVAVDRKEMVVLAGVSATNSDGSKPYEFKWALLEKRLISSVTAQMGGSERNVEFAYRENDRTVVATGMADITVSFGWDEDGRIVSIVEKSTGGDYGIAYAYDGDGNRIEKTVSRNDAVASKTVYTYDAEGKLVTQTTTLPDGTVSSETDYTYNDNGDLIKEVSQWQNDEPVVTKYSYTYDDSKQAVLRLTLNAQGAQVSKTEYTYDESGKLTRETLSGDGSMERTVEYTYETVRMSDAEHTLYRMLMEYMENWY